jgi:phage regulator Rha-like protein
VAKSHPARAIVSLTVIEQRIYLVRGKRVMLDSDLAILYEVKAKALNQALQRNKDRFPEDFAFQLSAEEYSALRSQIVTLKKGRGQHRKYLPYVFTEHGVTMLASVLKSDRAVQASIAIVRAFVHLRELLATHADLARRINDLEKKYDRSFADIFQAIRQLMSPPKTKTKRIGFDTER